MTTFFLIVTASLFTLSSLTRAQIAIPLATEVVATQFSPEGLDDPKSIEEVKQKLELSGQNVFYPLPDKNITITRSDLEKLSPREIRLKIFRQVVEPFYYQRINEQTKKQAGILAFINESLHSTIFTLFLLSFIPLLISSAGLIYFSYGNGRIISPAVVLVLVSSFPSLLLFLISVTRPHLGSQSTRGPIPFLPYEITRQIVAAIAPLYYILFLIGISLILISMGIKFTKKMRTKG